VRLYPHLWLKRVRVRVYPYKLITTIRNFTARPYLHLSQAAHLYIAAPTRITLYGETITNDDNPLLAKKGWKKVLVQVGLRTGVCYISMARAEVWRRKMKRV
jgi:hypothetical protein